VVQQYAVLRTKPGVLYMRVAGEGSEGERKGGRDPSSPSLEKSNPTRGARGKPNRDRGTTLRKSLDRPKAVTRGKGKRTPRGKMGMDG